MRLRTRSGVYSGSDNRLLLSNYSEAYFNKRITNHHSNGFVLLKIILTHKQILNTTANSLHHEVLHRTFTSPDKDFITFASHLHYHQNTSCLLSSLFILLPSAYTGRTCNLCHGNLSSTQSKVHYIKEKTSPAKYQKHFYFPFTI